MIFVKVTSFCWRDFYTTSNCDTGWRTEIWFTNRKIPKNPDARYLLPRKIPYNSRAIYCSPWTWNRFSQVQAFQALFLNIVEIIMQYVMLQGFLWEKIPTKLNWRVDEFLSSSGGCRFLNRRGVFSFLCVNFFLWLQEDKDDFDWKSLVLKKRQKNEWCRHCYYIKVHTLFMTCSSFL